MRMSHSVTGNVYNLQSIMRILNACCGDDKCSNAFIAEFLIAIDFTFFISHYVPY